MLTAYADLREQIERAREGASSSEWPYIDIVKIAWAKLCERDCLPEEWHEGDMVRALQSVAHLLPSGDRGVVDHIGETNPTAQAAQVDGTTARLLRDVRSIYIGSERPSGDGCDAETWDRIEAALSAVPTAEPVAQGESIACPECGTLCTHRAIPVSDDVIHEYTPVAAQPRAVPDGLKELADEVEACWICASNGEGEITLETINNWSGRLAMLAAAPSPGESA